MIPRSVRSAMFSPSTKEGVIALITVNRPGWDFPLRLTTHEAQIFTYDPLRSGCVHAGDQYDYAIVSTERPDDIPNEAATISIVIENVVEDLGDLAKQSVNDLVVTLKHVALLNPDTIIEEFPEFKVMSASADLTGNTLTFQVTLDPIENEPANMLKFDPSQFGGLGF